jgi:hypothetical protein
MSNKMNNSLKGNILSGISGAILTSIVALSINYNNNNNNIQQRITTEKYQKEITILKAEYKIQSEKKEREFRLKIQKMIKETPEKRRLYGIFTNFLDLQITQIHNNNADYIAKKNALKNLYYQLQAYMTNEDSKETYKLFTAINETMTAYQQQQAVGSARDLNNNLPALKKKEKAFRDSMRQALFKNNNKIFSPENPKRSN